MWRWSTNGKRLKSIFECRSLSYPLCLFRATCDDYFDKEIVRYFEDMGFTRITYEDGKLTFSKEKEISLGLDKE